MKTVLIIENDPAVRLPVEEALRGEGFEVVGAAHGAAGLAAAKEYLPDLVLCAERMPGMDGYHVARLLRQDPASGFPRFLLLIRGDGSAFLRGMAGGVDGVLRLPAAPAALSAAVRSQLEKEEPAATLPVPHIPLEGERGSRDASELLGDLAVATTELLGMVEKFLRFAQVRAGLERRRAQARTGGPRPAVGLVHSNQVGSAARACAERDGRGGDLNCHLEKGFLPLEMGELAVLIGELVENACRFSRPRAPIDVFYFRQGEGSEVMVRDYGDGMTLRQVEAIRTPSASEGEAGTKLGLAMVRMIAESRGGRLLVHSVPGVGTTVRVLIPDAVPDRPSAPGSGSSPVSDLGVPPFDEGGGGLF